MKVIIILGPPGSGKGTLAQLCASHFSWPQLSTGDLLRKERALKTEIGCAMDFAVNSGTLLEDRLVVDVIRRWIVMYSTFSGGCIIDGYPRTENQATGMNEIFRNMGLNIAFKVVRLQLGDAKAIKRLMLRRTCSNYNCQKIVACSAKQPLCEEKRCSMCGHLLVRRADDLLPKCLKRLSNYRFFESSVLNSLKAQGIPILYCDAAKTIQEVFKDTIAWLGLEPL